MVRPVSLSERAFAVLRKEKMKGESDSDVVIRLIEETARGRRDPRRFLRFRPERLWGPDEEEDWLARAGRMDEQDARQAAEYARRIAQDSGKAADNAGQVAPEERDAAEDADARA